MTNVITVTGLVATTPRHLVTQGGMPITSFRLASTDDGSQQTNWYTISSFNDLAIHSAGSISKGERIIVTGKLRIRDWDNGERAGTSVEIEADSMGHDLCWGTSAFTRTVLVRNRTTQVINPQPSQSLREDIQEVIADLEEAPKVEKHTCTCSRCGINN